MTEFQPAATQTQPHFMSNTDFWISEIRGDIARVNDLASIVMTDIYTPSATNNRMDKSDLVLKVRNFYVEFRRLYYNAEQIIPEDLRRDIESCLNVADTNMTNPEIVRESVKLVRKLQWDFANRYIKDIAVRPPQRFPYDYYIRRIAANNSRRPATT